MTQVAVLGYGVVGSGVAEAIEESAALVKERCGIALSLKSILDIRQYPESPFADRFVTDFSAIENDPAINVVVESIGGIKAAYDFTKRALTAGKHVVTSNKELVAEHGASLLALARSKNVHYLFEASVGGGVPILHPLAQCLTANRVTDIVGILNGTSNYILTRMKRNGFTFEEALREAQKMGYAEANPSADVEGHDCTRKISILASMMFGKHVPPSRVRTEGIERITPEQLEEASKKGYEVKLLGRAHGNNGKPCVFTAPHLVPAGHPLHDVSDVFNGIVVSGSISGDLMFYGRGAGKRPTASAILSDILDCVRCKDPLCGLNWSEAAISMSENDPSGCPSYTFADGSSIKVLES